MKDFQQPIIVQQSFENTVTEVWNAITQVDQMTKWYFPNIPDFEPVVGFETKFVVQVEDRVYPHVWMVTEVVPNRILAYEWSFEGYNGLSKSVFELSANGHQTELKLTAIVLEEFPKNIPEFERDSAVNGWNYLIRESLVNYLK